jgi:ribosomal-protein-alanine N-acetyltransferase
MSNRREVRGVSNIRKMIPEDLDQVLSIETSDSLAPWSKKMFLEEMQHPLAYCFVMKRKDGFNPPVVGFICFRNVTGESELLKICVHPDYRQLGIGKELMQFYIDFGCRRGVRTFHLEVNSSNQPAIHLYQSFSYHPSGMRKRFYQKKFDALLMMRQV